MRKFIVLFLLFFTISCTITRRATINFTEENNTSLIALLDAKDISYNKDDIAVLKDFRTFVVYNDTDKLVTPEAYFFNKDGYRVVNNFKGTRCGLVINNIQEVNNAPVQENKEHINDWLKDFTYLSLDSQHNKQVDYDVYVIITWAKFVDHISDGAANKISLDWYKSLKENPDLKIKTILLNIDIQESWALSDEHKEALGMEK